MKSGHVIGYLILERAAFLRFQESADKALQTLQECLVAKRQPCPTAPTHLFQFLLRQRAFD